MNALESHLHDQQDASAAFEAIARCLRAIAPIEDDTVEALVVDLSELAVRIGDTANRYHL